MNKTALDAFGKILMERVRDWSIQDCDKIISGQAKGVTAERLHQVLATFDAAHRQVLYRITPEIVDITLHYLLWMFEQEEQIDITVCTEVGIVPSLREISDGLAGELYDWIPRFSKQRYELE
jgi:hypothetical protein